MRLENLIETASAALFEIARFSHKNGTSPVLDSIKSQVQFIYDSAIARKNPLELISEDSPFTYGIFSLREFSSPEEMEIKEKLDQVTELLKSNQLITVSRTGARKSIP